MTDTITLRRAEAERGRTALRLARKFVGPTLSDELSIFLAALDAALAEPEPEPDAQCPTCGGGGLVPDPTWDWVRCDVCNPLPEKPEPTVKDSLTVDHIRSIWLDSWKACGNVPTPVLAEHFARQIERALAALAEPDAKREPYTLAELFAQFAAKQRPLDADMAAIINANLDSLYITDEPAAALAEPTAKREPATEEVIEAKFEKSFYVHPEALDDFAEGWCEAERFHGIRKENQK
jgi:hypothetical protein